MLQFFGTYFHRIDDKGRVALPKKFRKTYERAALNNELKTIEFVVTPSPARVDKTHSESLYVFTTEDFES